MAFGRYNYTEEEIVCAGRAKKLGWILVKDYSSQIYMLYNEPELLGVFTYKNELLSSHDLTKIRVYLEYYEQRSTDKQRVI